MYFKLDLKRLLHNRIIQIVCLALLAMAVINPLIQKGMFIRYDIGVSIGAHPFNYAGFEDTVTLMRFFFAMLPVFPVFWGGILYYEESKSSIRGFLVVRGKRTAYFLSKACSVFLVSLLTFLAVLFINIGIVYMLFPTSGKINEAFIPMSGTFAEILFEKSPLLLTVFYVFCYALTIALFSVFILGLQMCIRFPNRYIAMIAPVVILYIIIFILDSFVSIRAYDINIIIQPASSYAVTTIIKGWDYLITFVGWGVIDVILFGVGLLRNRDVI